MSSLVELKAVEALTLIRHAFELEKVDLHMRGPWAQVLKEIGVEPNSDDPLIAETQQRWEEEHARIFPLKGATTSRR